MHLHCINYTESVIFDLQNVLDVKLLDMIRNEPIRCQSMNFRCLCAGDPSDHVLYSFKDPQ